MPKPVAISHLTKLVADALLELEPASLLPNRRNATISQAIHGRLRNTDALLDAVEQDVLLGDLRRGWIQSGGGGHTLALNSLTHVLIRRALVGQSVGALVAQAHAFAKTKTAVTERYIPLVGITVAKSVKLDDNIHMLPWSQVPDGDAKCFFSNEPGEGYLDEYRSFFTQGEAKANSAIRLLTPKSQVLFSSSAEAGPLSIEGNELRDRHEIVQDVINCVAVVSKSHVAALGEWSQLSGKIGNALSRSGYSHKSSKTDFAIRALSSRPKTLDRSAAARIFKRFQAFTTDDKAVMRISLDRLNKSLFKKEMADQAIDLGIALEVMLLHGINDDFRGEMRYRMSVRGATFLGGMKPQRKNHFKLLKAAYDLRSKSVHTGSLYIDAGTGKKKKGKKKDPDPVSVLKSATGVCADIAAKIIERGSFPDWESEYVLGR
jgi:hypothetical protein